MGNDDGDTALSSFVQSFLHYLLTLRQGDLIWDIEDPCKLQFLECIDSAIYSNNMLTSNNTESLTDEVIMQRIIITNH